MPLHKKYSRKCTLQISFLETRRLFNLNNKQITKIFLRHHKYFSQFLYLLFFTTNILRRHSVFQSNPFTTHSFCLRPIVTRQTNSSSKYLEVKIGSWLPASSSFQKQCVRRAPFPDFKSKYKTAVAEQRLCQIDACPRGNWLSAFGLDRGMLKMVSEHRY